MEKYNFIETYSQFVLNETLLTHDINLTFKNVKSELSILRYDFNIEINKNNTISITLLNVSKTQLFNLLLDNLDNLMIDRHGWFPSLMNIENVHKMRNEMIYDEDYLRKNFTTFDKIEIIYEAKKDKLVDIPKVLYHLSIQEFEQDILKKGIIPKSKSKLSKHLDRIYLCSNVQSCLNLISRMKLHYSNKSFKNKINDKWMVIEIDGSCIKKLYQDPNYSRGFYCIDNIPPDKLKIIEKE